VLVPVEDEIDLFLDQQRPQVVEIDVVLRRRDRPAGLMEGDQRATRIVVGRELGPKPLELTRTRRGLLEPLGRIERDDAPASRARRVIALARIPVAR